MIESLRIRDLAIVRDVSLELGPGLNVLTGETGAGKSLLLGALALLAGARASADRVREGADEAVVEAVFRADPALAAALEARGIPTDDGALVVRRSIASGGRSRAWLGGQLVPIAALAELLGERIEVASQHESQALRSPETHGRLLDAGAGLEATRARVAEGAAALRRVQEELRRLTEDAEERERRRDYLAFQAREIDEAELQPGERERLVAERGRLLHAERLRAEAFRASSLLAGDPTAETPSASDAVGEAARVVAELAALDPALAAPAERLAAVRSELDDVSLELARYAEAVEADPERQAVVEARLALIERLARKYGADEAEILRRRESLEAELGEAVGADARLADLAKESEARAASLAREAEALSRGRAKAAGPLSKRLSAALAELALAGAAIEVALEPVPPPDGLPCGPTGAERPEFLFRANPGEPAGPLRRVASGGELSRVFLALRNTLREADAGRVLVFDEVDAGIGGAAAEKVGRALAELAGAHQVLCITHLPQVAALGSVHLRVAKRVQRGRTAVQVTPLAGEDRVEEVARMAGGSRVAEATRRHAEALLATGKKA